MPKVDKKSCEAVNALLEKEKVKWVHVQFADVVGFLKDFTIPAVEFINGGAWTDGLGFDGSSIKGFKEIHQSDMVAFPDPSTLRVIPFTEGIHKSARVICNIYEAYGGSRAECDSRYAADRALSELKKEGYETVIMGPELEFFVFQAVDPSRIDFNIFSPGVSGGPAGVRSMPDSLETMFGPNYLIPAKGGYFESPPIDTTTQFRNELSDVLWKMGVNVEMHHHEVATAGQVEIDMKPYGTTPYGVKVRGDVVGTGDSFYTYKFCARNIAKKYGMLATFMPKPMFGDNGSGMHVHQSVWKSAPPEGKNAFYDESDKYAHLSQDARYYIGGIIEHARALTAITSPTVNSYRRLVPGFEAPIFVCWSKRNRSAMVRVPAYHESSKATRVEVRSPDPSCNGYLAFSAMVMAGLDGIRKKLDPGDPVDQDVYHLSSAKKKEFGIKELPTSLKEAIEELESDEVIQEAVGKTVTEAFIDLKTAEWNRYSAYVSPWDFIEYFNI